MPSPARIGAFGKYLCSFAKHQQAAVASPSTSRRRLHLLYLIHDLLHHTKYHEQTNTRLFSTFSSSAQPFLVELIQFTASDCRSRVRSKLHGLLDIWEEDRYYSIEYIRKLRETARSAVEGETASPTNGAAHPAEPAKSTRDPPFVMPATHGDASVSYYDLPAGNMMPHIMPNSSAPIRSDQVKALQFLAGPADQGLVNAVKDFLHDIRKITGDDEDPNGDDVVADTDDLGQTSYRDEAGDIDGGDTYYGWSRSFCEKMRHRKMGREDADERRDRSRSQSYSSSRSRTKKRRYSDYSRSSSRSRSRSPPRRGIGRANITRSPPPRSRSISYSPPLPDASPMRSPHFQQLLPEHSGHISPPGRPPPPLPPSVPFHTQQNNPPFPPLRLGPNGLPIPPPPPPNYNGIWPPPIPPNINFPRGMNFSTPPPPFQGSPHHYFQGYRPAR